MAAPTSTNGVTARKLSSSISALWTKIKNTFAPKDDGQTTHDTTKFYCADGSWAVPPGTGAVTGVKGASESSYRTGNVNITASDVGALPSDGVASSAGFVSVTNRANNYNANNLGSKSGFRVDIIYTDNTTTSNLPITGYNVVETTCFSSTSYRVQKSIAWGSNRMWIRCMVSGTWSSWKEL